jgi:pimeloyl-ACP methyl ester carboxylesterase
MEPRIQYAQTKDGVSIAFWTMGEGIPIVYSLGAPFSHMQQEWELREFRPWYERLARNAKLIRYNTRGTGLSEREVTDHSLDAHVLDLEAVVDRLNLKQFSLYGTYHSSPAAERRHLTSALRGG